MTSSPEPVPPSAEATPSRLRVRPDGGGIRILIPESWITSLPWAVGLIVLWSGPALATYSALSPTLTPEATGILLSVLWGLPGILVGLAIRLLRRRREITVRPGELELDHRSGGRHTKDRYRFEALRVMDRRTLQIRLEPGDIRLDLGDRLDPATCEWLADQLELHSTTEAAPEGAASNPALRTAVEV